MSEDRNKIFLIMPRGTTHGWGICGRYVASELARMVNLRFVTDPFGVEDIGDNDQFTLLSRCFLPFEQLRESQGENGRICLDAPVVQAICGVNFRPWLTEVQGPVTIGYTFFEENIIAEDDLRWARDYYDMVAVGSSWCGEVLKSYGFSRTRVVIQGIDPFLFHMTGEKKKYRDAFVIFSGGKFEFRKGQDLVMRAVKVMQDRYKDVLLVNSWYNYWPESMATMSCSRYINLELPSGPYQDAIRHLVSINGLDPERVIILPPQPNALMSEVYRDSDIGLFPNRCEGGTNLVLMEYMACGRPVVASFLTGHRDVLNEDYALLVHAKQVIDVSRNKRVIARWEDPDLDEIIAQLDWAYHNRDANRDLGRRAAEAMSSFTWEETAKGFYDLVK
ncbi:MAG: glycosyltransferase family 4 protein [Pseudomonadota bacterium]